MGSLEPFHHQPSRDPESLSPRKAWGEWLYREIASQGVIESNTWATERARRASDRLQQGRPDDRNLEVVIPWLQEAIAFTCPGPYIYFSRRPIEMCRDDDMAAFVIAHEMAHHDLGHVDLFPDWLTKLTGEHVAPFLILLGRQVEKRLYGPQRECDADRHGFELCLQAGYDLHRCLGFFDVLEKMELDAGDLDIVFGPQESDEELAPDASVATKLRLWVFHGSVRKHTPLLMARGYLPLRDRRQRLLEYLVDW